MSDCQEVLSSLEGLIKTQLSYEYPDQNSIDEVYENLTVPKLLSILSYLFT